MKTQKHNVGDIHENGKWMWTEYKPGKFDWRTIKTQEVANSESENETEVKTEKTVTKKAKKLTEPQQRIIAKINNGYRAMSLKTRTMAGYVNAWVYRNEEGNWEVKETFTMGEYKTIQKLDWNGIMSWSDMWVEEDENTVYGYFAEQLHRQGVIGATKELIAQGY